MYPFNNMTHKKKQTRNLFNVILFSLISFFFLAKATLANEQKVGDITIYYNALSTVSIPAEVASQYSIKRSNKRGLVNISVIKNNKPIIANIFGHGKNITGQLKELAFKEIKEDDAIYYIATFNFNNAEEIIFDLKVQPEKQGLLMPLQFKQKLFID